MVNRPEVNNFQEAIQEALNLWHQFKESERFAMGDLLFVQARLADKGRSAYAQRLAINEMLMHGIHYLQAHQPTLGDILELRFAERMSRREVALKLNMSDAMIKHRQKAAIDALSVFLWEKECQMRAQHHASKVLRLPAATYSQLVEPKRGKQVESVLRQRGGSNVATIVGMGGIGKTALADCLTRQLLTDLAYTDVAWVRLEQPTISAVDLIDQLWQQLLGANGATVEQPAQHAQLRDYFGRIRTLIVLDNIETEQQLFTILDCLHSMLGKSKLLLTSRVRPPTRSKLFINQIEELSEAGACQLTKQHAAEIGFMPLASLSATQFKPIYQTVGGNPLALKLLVGLAMVLPLEAVLADFSRAKITKVDKLFHKIYWHAWACLDESARQLLEVAVLSTSGMDAQQMQAVSGLSDTAFWSALEALIQRALVETSSQTVAHTYRLHQLTRSFMQTEIIQLGGVE